MHLVYPLVALLLAFASSANAFDCPSGFLAVSNGTRTLGCIQEAEETQGGPALVLLDWDQASAFCFSEYGGRLPFPQEFIIAGSAVELTFGVFADWTSQLSDAYAGSGVPVGIFFTATSDGQNFSVADRIRTGPGTRCWIPREAFSAAGVPAILPWGQGLLVALMLSVAGGALLFRGRPLLTSGERGISARR